MNIILLLEHEHPKMFPLEYAKNNGYRVIVATNHFNSEFLNYVPEGDIINTDVFNSASVIEDVLYFCHLKGIHIDAVGTFREDLVTVTAELSSCLGCKGLNPLTARKTSNNKLLMRNSLSLNNKINQPKYTVFNIFDEATYSNITIPSVVKPIFGTASHGVFLIRTSDDISSLKDNILSTVNTSCRESFLRFKGNMLCEEYIEGDLVSIDGFASENSVDIVGSIEFIMGNEPYFTQISSYIPSRLRVEDLKSCYSMVNEIIMQLELKNSAFHAEFRVKNGTAYLIEIGARLPGASIHETYGKVYGINMVELMFKCWLGEYVSTVYEQKGVNYHTLIYPEIDKSGSLVELTGLAEINKDDSVWYVRQIAKIGDQIEVYPNIPTPVLEFSCFAKSLDEIEAKYSKIKSLIKYKITNN